MTTAVKQMRYTAEIISHITVNAFYDGKPLNDDEKTAMKDCCELFIELLQHGHLSNEGYKEVDLALLDVYTEIDESHDDE